ncbi:IS4 family transposase, partial [Butyrivibrio sp. NC2002]|uniref:IS4 family transposase n=1 Tax=Butyrivibrio sp. NC2002 TaxID=1410610 RepID=UPI00056B7CA3
DNVATELLDLFGEEDLPLPSAMIQRRNQIKKEAFKELFFLFNRTIPVTKTFRGYRLIACDGTRLNLPYNPSDHRTLVNNIEGRKGFNQAHMNALYDILNDLFIDVEIQGMNEMDENGAFCRFLDKHSKLCSKTIYIADRGYATFNNYAHALRNNQLFLFRMKETDALNLCPSQPHIMDGAYVDEDISIHVGRRRKKSNRKYGNYHFVRKRHRYDFIAPNADDIDILNFRVLKFPLSSGKMEYIATNLPSNEFPLKLIKDLYNLRWGEETAFRHLKYAGNMVHIHSIKPDFLIQEIYGKLTLYNFSSCITKAMTKRETSKTAYTYNFNHTQMQKFVRLFLIERILNLEKLMNKFLVAVRPGRKFKRIMRRQSAKPLSYR